MVGSEGTSVVGHWRLVGDGIGISWPRLDEDLSVAGLLGMRET